MALHYNFRIILFLVLVSCALLSNIAHADISYYKADLGSCSGIVTDPSTRAPVDPSYSGIRKRAGEFKTRRSYGSWNKKHTGVDVILSDVGRNRTVVPVHAIADGKVVLNALKGGFDSSFGYTRILDHGNGCFSFYSHLTDKNYFLDKGLTEDELYELSKNLKTSFKRGEIIGHMIEPSPFGVKIPTGNIRRISGTAKFHLHFGLISSTKEGCCNIRHSYFHDKKIENQFGHWVDPTQIFTRQPDPYLTEDINNNCPPSNSVCKIKDEDINRYLGNRTGVEPEVVLESASYLDSASFDNNYAKDVVYRSSPMMSIVHTGFYADLVKQMESEGCADCQQKIRNNLAKNIAEKFGSSIDVGAEVSSEVTSAVQIVLNDFNLGLNDESQQKMVASYVQMLVNNGENKEKAVISATLEFGLKYTLANTELGDVMEKAAEVQSKINKYISKVDDVQNLGDDVEKLSASISKISDGQLGVVEGTNAVIGSINAIANGMEGLGVKIGKDGKKVLKKMNEIGSFINIGASLFAGGFVNPLAIASSGSQLIGLFSGGGIGVPGGGPDPYILGQLDIINGKLDVIDQKLDQVLENQQLIIDKLAVLETKLAELEKTMLLEFTRLHDRLNQFNRSINDVKLNVLATCNDIDKNIHKYLHDERREDLKIIQTPAYHDLVSDYFNDMSKIYSESQCDAGAPNRDQEACNYFLVNAQAISCVSGMDHVFETSCNISTAFREERTLNQIAETPNQLDHKIKVFGKFINIPEKQLYEDGGGGVALLNKIIASKMYAYGIPSVSYNSLNLKLTDIEKEDTSLSPRCAPAASGYQDNLFREALISPLKEDEVLYYANKSMKILPFIAKMKEGDNSLFTSTQLANRMDSILYHLELLLIQKTISSGDMILLNLVNSLKKGIDLANKSDLETFRNIVLSNTKEEDYLKTNIGLYLVYNSENHPYGAYMSLYNACLQNEYFCDSLYERLNLDCGKDNKLKCGTFDSKITSLPDKKLRLGVKVSFEDGKIAHIPLPKPYSHLLEKKHFVYPQEYLDIFNLYMSFVKYRFLMLTPKEKKNI